ncbi:hypothetical protein T459_34312 [Capsicum annuum]|uniref:Calpain-type cysteine protease DEK1 n=1 Tax=Capsicum annuum TaxID=4072 RepID=A0A2G2XWD6_CAPAN|nr:hypothetical protein T459_34312 [Capsicum annuum]
MGNKFSTCQVSIHRDDKEQLLLFLSSTNDANKTPSPPLKSKEVSSWRSVSLSSGSFYDSGSGKKNFTDLSKSPHGHSKKVHPKKSGRDSSRDLSVPVLIRTIRRLTKEKVQMASEVSSMLRNQVAERASAKVKDLKSETVLTTVLREKLYSEEMDIKQLQANLAATIRGNDILKCEVQNALDALSYATPKLKYLELQNLHLRSLRCCLKLMFKFSFLTAVHQNSTCGAAENVGTAAKPNGITHEPVRADRPNAFSNNSSFVLSCIQTAVDIPSKTAGPSTFELPDHALVGPGREGGVRVGESPSLLGSELYFGHCISYAVVASVLLGAAVSRNLSVTDPLAARRDALQSTVIRLREGFRRKDQNSSASSSEECGSSVKRSSSADAGHLGNTTVPCTGDGSTWNNIEGFNSDKSIDSGRPSLAPRSSSCRSVAQEPEVGSSYVDRNLEHNSSLVVCSSSGLESQGGDSSTSTSANQQILGLNLAVAFQEKLSDPRITSMLKRKGRHTDRELANLLQDKGLDPNFAVMLKENGLDPMILALLQRSSLDADREHRDSNPPVTDSNDVEDVLPNHISFSEELIPRIRKVASTL